MDVLLLTGETIEWDAFVRSTDGDRRVAQARIEARYDGEGQQDIGAPHDHRLGLGA